MTTNATPTTKELFQLLKAPFHSKAIEWKIGNKNKEQNRGRALPFLKFQAVADRLDDVLGCGNWKSSYVSGPAGGVVCRLEVRVDGEWISKENGAGNTEMEGIKGGLTDAFKRAATMWGVGRYLHSYEALVVDINERGQFQAPALPDEFLPADEVEQNRKDAEAAAAEEKVAAAAVEAAVKAAGEAAPATKVTKPAKPAKVSKTAEAKEDAKSSDDVVVEAGTGAEAEAVTTAPDAAAQSDGAAEVPAEVVAEVTAEAVVETEIVVDGPADTAPVDTLENVAQAEPVAEPAAEPEVAAEAIAEASPEVPAVVAETSAEAANEAIVIAFDETGVPVMPDNLPEVELKLVTGLINRLSKPNVPLFLISDYVQNGPGEKALGAAAKAYVMARVDHQKRQTEAASKEQAA